MILLRRRHDGPRTVLAAGVMLTALVLVGCSASGEHPGTALATASPPPPGAMGPGSLVVLRSVTDTTTAVRPVPSIATVVRPPATSTPRPPATATAAPVPTPTAPRPSEAKAVERIPAAATTGPKTTPTAPPALITYHVQRGDDIYRIARRFGVAPAAIIQVNALQNPSKIEVGQVLHIPVDRAGTSTPAT